MTLRLTFITLSLTTLLAVNAEEAPKKYSQLWGKNGELWKPGGRLPDFSYAGYHHGEKSIPDVPVKANVTDFGATPNDDTDDAAAIQKAIDSIDQGAVLIPRGRYILKKPIRITRSHIVIKGQGQGPNGTILYCPLSATDLNGGKRKSGFSQGSEGQFILFAGQPQGKGLGVVRGSAARGTHRIRVAGAEKMQAGRHYLFYASDLSHAGPFWQYLHNNRVKSWYGGLVKWAGANAFYLFKVDAVNGDEVTIHEPLRFDIRPDLCRVGVMEHRCIQECGIENLRIAFPSGIAPAHHLQEPGYNGIGFINAFNCWARSITIENSDNAINCHARIANIELRRITLTGRRGHHGITLSNAHNCLIWELTDNCREPWIHTITMDHMSCGNVNANTSGTNTVSLDFHRHCPFANLHTCIKAKWNFESSGDPKAGPHAGARNTYWNLSGRAPEVACASGQGKRDNLYRSWGKIQTNLITSLAVSERMTPDEEWYENISDPHPANLYLAQLKRRLHKQETTSSGPAPASPTPAP